MTNGGAMRGCRVWAGVLAVGVALVVVAGAAHGQLQTGNLFGSVVDEKDHALPGVTVTLTGNGAPSVQVTNAKGRFRFLGLTPSSYKLQAELEGFATVEYPNIRVNVGRNTTIEVSLRAAEEPPADD